MTLFPMDLVFQVLERKQQRPNIFIFKKVQAGQPIEYIMGYMTTGEFFLRFREKNNPVERITMAANLVGNRVLFVSQPGRHHHCEWGLRYYVKASTKELESVKQGFVTNFGRFVDRVEAREIAMAAGQTVGRKPPTHETKLFSEDLWDSVPWNYGIK